MARASHQTAWVALLVSLSISVAARADEPAPPALSAPAVSASSAPLAAPSASSARLASPAPSASGARGHGPASARPDVTCGDAVVDWAERASSRTGLTITPVACPAGLVRLQVAGAGCDFEVRREQGFQRTASGAFGVSPIVDLDWTTAPEPMKKALTGILTALTEDPSLQMDNRRRSSMRLGSRRKQIAAGAALVVILAAALAFWWKRRRAPGAAP